MKISSPPNLHYPVTVGEIAASVNDVVKRSDPLFTYFYETTIEEGNKWGETIQVKKKFPVRFEASLGGIIKKWYIKTGAVIHRPGVNLVDIEEPCSHEIQFGGLCAECGLDMTEMDYQTQELNSDRAKINMTHGSMALLISQKEAVRAEEDSKKRLLSAKKLSLIVDLDQTVIHTTCERTIAEWQADPDNPNYGAVKDVKGFQLADDNAAHIVASWYYVKMRPGLKNFFEQMSKLYEMHIYTMATRAYAEEVARIIDPQRKYFGERILSRDENYGEKLKSLNRLFPNNTDMAVIIDDRADIWSYCENLVRVPVFNFFPGAGDINASFLPKQQELVTQTQTPKAKTADVTATPEGKAEDEPAIKLTVGAYPIETETKTKPAEPSKDALNDLEQQLISMGAGKGTEALELQVKEQEKVIIEQQTERPLLQQQLVLDKEDEEAEVDEVTQTVENGSTQNTDHHKHRHGVLHDDDRGLEVIEAHLRLVHQTFYEEYQKNKVVPHGGRVAELKGYKSPKKRPLDDVVPDVAEIMPRLKRETLSGCVIVFSGIIPLGVDVQK
jgi:RNA polymerase II subunit A-like phosphatase